MGDFEDWEVNFGGLIDEQEHSIAVAAFNAGAAAQIEKDAEIVENTRSAAGHERNLTQVELCAAAIRAQLTQQE